MATATATAETGAGAERPPRGALTLKTYDPVSGAALKYRTTKAAEVSRLVLVLGQLGRRMAGLPPAADGAAADEAMIDAGAERTGTPAPAPAPAPAAAAAAAAAVAPEKAPAAAAEGAAATAKGAGQGQQQQPQGGGGGKGKKKRGKK